MASNHEYKRRPAGESLCRATAFIWIFTIVILSTVVRAQPSCDPNFPASMADCDVCNSQHRNVLGALAQSIHLDQSRYVLRPGQTAIIRGSGFTSLPPKFIARFGSRDGNGQFRHDLAPVARVINDLELELEVPPTVREGVGIFLLGLSNQCTWASAGQIVTGQRLAIFDTSKRFEYLAATPTNPATNMLTILLDFDGYRDTAYPVEGDGTALVDMPAFSRPGLKAEIFTRVKEDFEPLNVVVTMQDPGNLDGHPERGIRVAIGGAADTPQCNDGIDNDGDGYVDHKGDANQAADHACDGRAWWNNETSASVELPVYGPSKHGDSANPGDRNTVLVAEHDSNGNPREAVYIAQTASHEVGHALGFMIGHPLSHYQARHSVSGTKTPMLGAQVPGRSVWFKDDSVIIGVDRITKVPIIKPQDDFASILSAVASKPDDHPNSPDRGIPLEDKGRDSAGYRSLSLDGVIEMNSASWPQCAPKACAAGTPPSAINDDHDFFQFQVDGGIFEISATGIATASNLTDAGNLDADLELWIYRGDDLGWVQLLDYANVADGRSPDAKIQWPQSGTSADAGLYAVGVKSVGGIGDLGRYGVLARGRDIRVVGPD